MGIFKAEVEARRYMSTCEFRVLDGKAVPLIGRDTAIMLVMLVTGINVGDDKMYRKHTSDHVHHVRRMTTEMIKNKFPEVFDSVGS